MERPRPTFRGNGETCANLIIRVRIAHRSLAGYLQMGLCELLLRHYGLLWRGRSTPRSPLPLSPYAGDGWMVFFDVGAMHDGLLQAAPSADSSSHRWCSKASPQWDLSARRFFSSLGAVPLVFSFGWEFAVGVATSSSTSSLGCGLVRNMGYLGSSAILVKPGLWLWSGDAPLGGTSLLQGHCSC